VGGWGRSTSGRGAVDLEVFPQELFFKSGQKLSTGGEESGEERGGERGCE
jgi:hypothetical protein